MSLTPLSGIRVVDMSELVPGPHVGQNFAELGATVTKVERPAGDNARALAPGVFEALNHGKTSIRLDLKAAGDLAQFRTLLADTDVLIEGFRPGVLARLGLAPVDLLREFPQLVIVSLCGYDTHSEQINDSGHDLNYAGYSGVLSLAGGDPDVPEWAPGVPTADLVSAMYAFSSVLAALLGRVQTGRGAHVEVPITDSLAHWLNVRVATFEVEQVTDLRTQREAVQARAAYGIYTCRDGEQITIGALEDHFWANLIQALQLDEWADPQWARSAARRTRIGQINAELAEKIAQYDAEPLLELLRAADVPCGPVLGIDDALALAAKRGKVTRSANRDIELFSYPARFTTVEDT